MADKIERIFLLKGIFLLLFAIFLLLMLFSLTRKPDNESSPKGSVSFTHLTTPR
ncbi:MAG TPA: hypothetical protein VJC12_01340 [Candidatus Paceibacterota bacterium]